MLKFTKRLIDDTPSPSSGQIFLRDCVLRDFALRVTKGTKTFVLEKRVRGRVRRITIGPYGPLTVDRARKQAEAYVGAPSHKGKIRRKLARIGSRNRPLAIWPYWTSKGICP